MCPPALHPSCQVSMKVSRKSVQKEGIEPEILLNYFKDLHTPNSRNNFDQDFAERIEKASIKTKQI